MKTNSPTSGDKFKLKKLHLKAHTKKMSNGHSRVEFGNYNIDSLNHSSIDISFLFSQAYYVKVFACGQSN
jgi:hypothetical protein